MRIDLRRLLGEAVFRVTPAVNPGEGPDFVCIGMAKAGTRWFYDQMAERPDVWMPPVKEINFLGGVRPTAVERKIAHESARMRTRNGRLTDIARQRRFLARYGDHVGHDGDYAWYRHLFDPKGRLKSGDVSPGYAGMSPDRIAAAAAALPRARFVLLVREPADRLWSLLCMQVRSGRLDAGLLSDWPRLSAHLARRPHPSWFPTAVMRNWTSVLGPDRLRHWFLDDIAERPETVVAEMCAYLGLAPGPGLKPAGYNRKRNNAKLPLLPEVRAGLAALMAEERQAAAAMLGGRALEWPDRR